MNLNYKLLVLSLNFCGLAIRQPITKQSPETKYPESLPYDGESPFKDLSAFKSTTKNWKRW